MAPPSAYVLCGTPRAGSTMLCSLLSSTGVLGRPESYFRQPEEALWAQRVGVAAEGTRVHGYDYCTFVQAVQAMATTDNRVFAARIMWGSIGPIVERLGASQGESDVSRLEQAFGPLTFVYLQREDVFAQPASWARSRADQLLATGRRCAREPEEDLAQMKTLLRTVVEHNEAWQSWFDSQRVQPHLVTYEQLVHDSRGVVEGVAARKGVGLPATWQPGSPHRRQADEINHRWATALRAVLDGG